MDTYLALAGIIIPSLIGLAQLRRTPKRKPEPAPFLPTGLMIIGVPMNNGRDLPGYRR